MSYLPQGIPAYRLHKHSGKAVVTLSGCDFYLGEFNSEQSRAEYQRRVGEWLMRGRKLEAQATRSSLSVNELMLAYLRHADSYYRDMDGNPSGEVKSMAMAFRPLKELYGFTPAAEFSPLALKTVRQRMIQADLCRKLINQRIGYIKRLFAWGASEELIPGVVHYGLLSVKGLPPYRGGVRETPPVKPVPDEYVDAIVPYLPPTLQCMLALQRLTGMRSGELTQMRACDIDMAGSTWLYRPHRHKLAWRGKERVIPLGPKCQQVLAPFLKLETTIPLFSPKQAAAERYAAMRARRKTRVQPSQISRKSRNPIKSPGDCYDTRAYYQALRYAMELAAKAGALARDHFWHPHQLRHSAALRIQRQHGLEAARAYLGHAKPDMTAMYAGIDTAVAMRIASTCG